MKKYTFSLRMLILFLCAAISIQFFCGPDGENQAQAKWSEMRGVWVSTVANIDYPSQQTTDANVLRNDLITLLDNCQAMGFNTIFFQVRPASDALYASSIFPWSRYLTGTQGTAPDQNFDPLAFAVEEAHARNMELHAWINPYRITNSSADNDKLASNNPAVQHPELVIYDSDGKMYYNPGDSASINLIVDGAVEIVKNYDVDGIHMDDYFYPSGDFNDDTTYSFYKDEYPDKGDWRRAMVNKLVQQMDEAVHAENPDIEFGISPRGIWANASEMPEGSDTNGGGSYNQIYADSRAWVKNGWVDYIMPQIYWNIGYEIADYSVLTQWWSDVVDGTDVRLYIGEGAYRTTSSTLPAWTGDNGTNELRQHVALGRSNDLISGYCMFTYHTFLENRAIFDLMTELNAQPAVSLSNGEEPSDPQTPETTPEPAPETDSNADSEQSDVPLVTDKPEDEAYVNKFQDMDDYWWAMDAVNALASQGIIRGRSETEFDPDSYITRADNTVLLLRILGKQAEFEDNFDDVYPGTYYYNEIGMAKTLGIAQGYGNNLFDPDNYIKRQDMATLAYRVLQEENILTAIPNTADLNAFLDKDSIDFYARDAMAACVGAGLMSGYGDGWINPQGNATRIEVALFMYRIQNLMQNSQTLTE
ncbi:family 10 glycosylhydrolase [Ructibacterium gallinarum]|uniref:Family 10 glycosylhydrolase n=1 Tax=Ructibacterium gallinarum TaxID=2779355 RepID=A0A9D5M2S9_9FIRM|nr:family 10 glycosylhydrolase [Ructibacterium gallinarum]MBE5040448.1 family 10 glycosylhydrolase [Ructibacterium gallinarum]